MNNEQKLQNALNELSFYCEAAAWIPSRLNAVTIKEISDALIKVIHLMPVEE